LRDSRWLGVEQRHRDVLARWLVEQSFAAFFEVLTRTAQEQHWSSRSSFWKQYLESGFVVDAWPVFGKDGARFAEGRLDSKSYAVRGFEGRDPAQSVLLMRLRGPTGSVVVAESTHNGMCRWWLDESPQAPEFYKRRYTQQELARQPDWDLRHAGDANGVWQQKARIWIRSRTGAVALSSASRWRV
jgi:hypothetical protein